MHFLRLHTETQNMFKSPLDLDKDVLGKIYRGKKN